MQGIRTLSEWRRWEEANKWAWEGSKRRRWAESLWRRQHIRRLQKRAFQENQAKAKARFAYEQHQEAKRRARWGYREQNVFAGTASACEARLCFSLLHMKQKSPGKPHDFQQEIAKGNQLLVLSLLSAGSLMKAEALAVLPFFGTFFLTLEVSSSRTDLNRGIQRFTCAKQGHVIYQPWQLAQRNGLHIWSMVLPKIQSNCSTNCPLTLRVLIQNFYINSADTESGGARKDFLGYYTLLGLDPDIGSSFSLPDIKKAFHEAALRWHPDHLHVSQPHQDKITLKMFCITVQ